MKHKVFSAILFVLFSPSRAKADDCSAQDLNLCLTHGGGQACFEKWECAASSVGKIPAGASTYSSRGTGYYPDASELEGGFYDRLGRPLQTLQDHLLGKAEYVSVAMDVNAFPYGTKIRIPQLEKKYGRRLEFRVVDTGGAFKGKGTSRIDICTRNEAASLDSTVNSQLTLVLP